MTKPTKSKLSKIDRGIATIASGTEDSKATLAIFLSVVKAIDALDLSDDDYRSMKARLQDAFEYVGPRNRRALRDLHLAILDEQIRAERAERRVG